MNERDIEAEQLTLELATNPAPDRIRKIRARLTVLNQPSFIIQPKNPFRSGSIIALDECSMAGEEEGQDLLSFGIPVLVLGDPYQLPPIKGKGYFNSRPDYILTQIHRQAENSPIIKLATMAREGRRPPVGKHGDSRVMSRRAVTLTDLCDVDQVITGSNKARIDLNRKIRRHRGFTAEYPEKGEKIICLRNSAKTGILNGQLFELDEDVVEFDNWTVQVSTVEGKKFRVHKDCFHDPDALKSWDYQRRKLAEEIDWAWALTAHKTQGSEFPSTLVYADMWQWNPEEFSRWLYSALTRASDRTILAL
jgi:exodeoxyribonuclease-5